MKLSPTIVESTPRVAIRRFHPSILALLVLLLACVTPAFSQEGTILGSVTDPTGAAVPNAPITITRTDTGQIRHVTTDSTGQYASPALTIGSYSVRVEATGFKPVEKR